MPELEPLTRQQVKALLAEFLEPLLSQIVVPDFTTEIDPKTGVITVRCRVCPPPYLEFVINCSVKKENIMDADTKETPLTSALGFLEKLHGQLNSVKSSGDRLKSWLDPDAGASTEQVREVIVHVTAVEEMLPKVVSAVDSVAKALATHEDLDKARMATALAAAKHQFETLLPHLSPDHQSQSAAVIAQIKDALHGS